VPKGKVRIDTGWNSSKFKCQKGNPFGQWDEQLGVGYEAVVSKPTGIVYTLYLQDVNNTNTE